METLILILVFLGHLFVNTPYTQEYIDYKIHVHQREIDSVQSNPELMQQVVQYPIKQDEFGRVVIINPDNMED